MQTWLLVLVLVRILLLVVLVAKVVQLVVVVVVEGSERRSAFALPKAARGAGTTME